MKTALPGALTIRAALVLGFGATVALWLFASVYFTRRMTEVQRDAGAVNARYTQAQELLSSVRMQVLLGSVMVRDALLDPEPGHESTYRTRLLDVYEEVDQALARYVPILDSDAERQRVDRLRREIAVLRSTLIDVLATDPKRWRTDAYQLLGQTLPRREAVLRVSNEVQSLNRSAFVQQQQALAAIYASTQRRVLQTLGLALSGSLGIALIATAYTGRLERTLRQQRIKDRQNASDLHRLSAKLVTVQEEERRIIARELHDEVGQVLQAVKVELSLAQRAIEAASGPPRLLDAAQTITDGALHTVRDLSHLLHPALLDDFGLPAAIDSYLDAFGPRHGISVELLQQGMTERLAPEIEAAVYRIVQEGLTNIAKHASATLALIYLRRDTDRQTLVVTIEDNGVGFAPVQGRRGLGLIGIRERASHLNGTVSVDSAPGKGTRLTVEFPARRRAEADVSEFDAADSSSIIKAPEVLIGKTATADR
jgi:signal transduction histidine kinase